MAEWGYQQKPAEGKVCGPKFVQNWRAHSKRRKDWSSLKTYRDDSNIIPAGTKGALPKLVCQSSRPEPWFALLTGRRVGVGGGGAKTRIEVHRGVRHTLRREEMKNVILILSLLFVCIHGSEADDKNINTKARQSGSAKAVILTHWASTTDSILYIDDAKSMRAFRDIWHLNNGSHILQACGFTYDIHFIYPDHKTKWRAAANMPCSTIYDGKRTYFNKIRLIDSVLKLAKPGFRHIDTVPDQMALASFLSQVQSNQNYLGYDAGDGSVLFQVVSTDRDRIESSRKKLYSKFSYFSDTLFANSMWAHMNESELTAIKRDGIHFDSTKIGVIVVSYYRQ